MKLNKAARTQVVIDILDYVQHKEITIKEDALIDAQKNLMLAEKELDDAKNGKSINFLELRQRLIETLNSEEE